MSEKEAKAKKKERLDIELVRRGLAPAMEKAQALIMAGRIRVSGQRVDKPDFRVSMDWAMEVERPFPYVSRGALKIERAIEAFAIRPEGKRVLDIGISTGGFSDFLLQRGAAAVIGVDVTISQVAERLRRDPRVRLLKKNARYLLPDDVNPAPDLIVMDLSFISVTKVLPALAAFPAADIVALIKPQFEAERGRVGKGGVVRDEERRKSILLGLKPRIVSLGFSVLDAVNAGIPGKSGNRECFFLMRFNGEPMLSDVELIRKVALPSGGDF